MIDSDFKIGKNYYLQVILEESKRKKEKHWQRKKRWKDILEIISYWIVLMNLQEKILMKNRYIKHKKAYSQPSQHQTMAYSEPCQKTLLRSFAITANTWKHFFNFWKKLHINRVLKMPLPLIRSFMLKHYPFLAWQGFSFLKTNSLLKIFLLLCI